MNKEKIRKEIREKIKNIDERLLTAYVNACVAKSEELKQKEYEPDGKVKFNIWVKGDKIRAYYKCSWYSKYANGKWYNFIDLTEILPIKAKNLEELNINESDILFHAMCAYMEEIEPTEATVVELMDEVIKVLKSKSFSKTIKKDVLNRLKDKYKFSCK